MALFHINHPSDIMNKNMEMKVIIPDTFGPLKDQEGRFPVMYLLHGYTDDYTRWTRMTSIERYANDYGIAVIMPDAGKSFYTDMAYGDPYLTYITSEIPAMIQNWFNLTQDPKYTFVAGLSMGGYGALKLALTYPERYKSVASFSGALLAAQTAAYVFPEGTEPWMKRLEKDIRLVFSDVTKVVGTDDDLLHLAFLAKHTQVDLPELYISCGTEDFLLNNTELFCQALDELQMPYHYYEEPAVHEWGFWDREIKRFMVAITS